MISGLVKRILALMPGKQIGGKLVLPVDLPDAERQIVRGVVAALVDLEDERRRLESIARAAVISKDPAAMLEALEALAAALGYVR